jgi:tRNA wybutosine-synthesizing protein 1
MQQTQSDNILKLTPNLVQDLQKKQYGIYNHSGVQICSWNKKALRGQGVCYKEEFYGVDCHRCMEFSPSIMWCQQNCTFCWRPMENMKPLDMKQHKIDEPFQIITNLIEKRKKLLSGFGGNDNVDLNKLEEAKIPNHFAISLSGEPTLYPKLNEMIKYLKSQPQTRTTFIVSNGQETSYYHELQNDKEALPTQLYISIDAPNEELFKQINRSIYPNGFQKLNESIKYFSKLPTRKVFRMTQIKGLNDKDEYLQGYKELIGKGNPDFIEVKGYMYLGLSRKRHKQEEMPNYEDVLEFAKKIIKTTSNYEIAGEAPNTLLVILKRKDSPYELKIDTNI